MALTSISISTNNSSSTPLRIMLIINIDCHLSGDDAFFQPDWAGACWGRWAGPGLMLGLSAGSGCGSSLQKEQERRRAGRGFARGRSDA